MYIYIYYSYIYIYIYISMYIYIYIYYNYIYIYIYTPRISMHSLYLILHLCFLGALQWIPNRPDLNQKSVVCTEATYASNCALSSSVYLLAHPSGVSGLNPQWEIDGILMEYDLYPPSDNLTACYAKSLLFNRYIIERNDPCSIAKC